MPETTPATRRSLLTILEAVVAMLGMLAEGAGTARVMLLVLFMMFITKSIAGVNSDA